MSKFSITSPLYHCSIEKAFDYVSNVDNRPEWQRPLDAVERVTPAPDKAGTNWREKFRMLGMTNTAHMSYPEFERPTLFVEDANLPMCTGRIDMVFSTDGDGCRLTVVADINWKGLFKLFAPLLAHTFKKMVIQDLGDIKRILESSND